MPVIINQEQAKRLLEAVSGSHVLLLGPPGSGKTLIALAYLSRFGRVLELDGGRVTSRLGFLTRFRGPVLVDEAHRLKEPELLYPLLDGPKGRVFAFTTTDEGLLPGPLLTRLVQVALRPYTTSDLAQIGLQAAPNLRPSTLDKLALLARGSPRRVKMLARLVSSVAPDAGPDAVLQILHALGHPLGFTLREVAYLNSLRDRPRSISTLAGLLGTGRETIRTIEAELIRMGLVEITGRGRSLTSEGSRVLSQLEDR